MKSLNSILVVLIFAVLIGCKNDRKPSTYEAANKDSSNFALELHSIYHGEEIKVLLNNVTILSFTGDTLKESTTISKLYNFPDKIRTVDVVSQNDGKKVINKHFDNSFECKKISLFVSPPFPDTIKNISLDANWKPNWNYVPIDKSKRRIVLEPDTLMNFSCGLSKGSR